MRLFYSDHRRRRQDIDEVGEDVIAETVERLVKGGVEKEVAEKMAKKEVGGLVKKAEAYE